MPRFDTVYWPGLDDGYLASSKLSITDTNNRLLATNVDEAIDELATASSAVETHLADTVDAHDASAISLLDSGGEYSSTNVEGALSEAGSRLQAAEDDISGIQSTLASAMGYEVVAINQDLDYVSGITSTSYADWTAGTGATITWTAEAGHLYRCSFDRFLWGCTASTSNTGFEMCPYIVGQSIGSGIGSIDWRSYTPAESFGNSETLKNGAGMDLLVNGTTYSGSQTFKLKYRVLGSAGTVGLYGATTMMVEDLGPIPAAWTYN